MFIMTTTGCVPTYSSSCTLCCSACFVCSSLTQPLLLPCAYLCMRSEVIIEKHWRGLTSRNVCDFFMEEVNKYKEREDVPPIITTSKYYLVSVFRDDLFLLAVVTNEVRVCFSLPSLFAYSPGTGAHCVSRLLLALQISPLFVIEFLHRVLAVFRDYFGSFDENSMKDNFSTVYQVRRLRLRQHLHWLAIVLHDYKTKHLCSRGLGNRHGRSCSKRCSTMDTRSQLSPTHSKPWSRLRRLRTASLRWCRCVPDHCHCWAHACNSAVTRNAHTLMLLLLPLSRRASRA